MWFTENPWPPMLIAALGAMIFFAVWNGNRKNLFLILAIICLLLTPGFYVVERAIVTQGEKLRADIAQLCDQFRNRQPETLNHFSNSVPQFKDMCKAAMDLVEVGDDLRLTDFQTTFSDNDTKAKVHFRANGTFSAMGFKGHHPFRCILTYQKEGDTWKIVDVARLDPIKGNKIGVLDRQ